jgi:hypothetical protein
MTVRTLLEVQLMLLYAVLLMILSKRYFLLLYCVRLQTEQEAKQWVKLKLEVAAMTASGGANNSSSDPNASYVEPEESSTGTNQQRQ